MFYLIVISLFSQNLMTKQDSVSQATPKIEKEAMFYLKLPDEKTQCLICFRKCIIPVGKRGMCFNKENRNGILYSIVYAKPSAVQIDPIEKEPVYHFFPSSQILCIGTAGCNFKCKHCHNWHLSQQQLENMQCYYLPPEDVIKVVKKYNLPSISFTYNDPISFYEYMYDVSKLAKKHGIKILWHTNAAINPQPLKEMLKYTDAVTVDLKGFTEEFYKKQSSGNLETVLSALKIIKASNVWLEIVNLVIPTLNDNPKDVKRMCEWIKQNLGDEVPLHFTRFFPTYKTTNLPPTPVETLEKLYQIAKDVGLKYVYIGNVPGHKYNSTYCPNCKELLIHRIHFEVIENKIRNSSCPNCKYTIAGFWE